jgi:hypothetical protein
LLKQYCPAQESRDLQKVAEIHPSADLVERKRTFNQYASIRCEMAEQGTWKFDHVDGAKGTARLHVAVKQTYEPRSGGFPEVIETIADFVLTRPSERADWQIVSVRHTRKPKS